MFPLEQQSFHKNTCKYPKPEIPANIKIPIPLKGRLTIDLHHTGQIDNSKQNCVGGNPKFAKIK
jgi:hypothetical protein